MTTVGTAYIKIMPTMDGFSKSVTSSLNSSSGNAGTSAAQSFSAKFKASGTSLMATGIGAIAGVASSLATSAFSAIGASMGAAISRVDTLNNFPKVMQNLGYSAIDATDSINKIATALDGLPSSTDDVASMVQQIAPMCDSLEEATNLGLALNDMFLASGASSADCSRAMQQYTQILNKGVPDLQDWKTLQEIMPGQLNQVAAALLGAGASSSDLYSALKDGTLTMNDFNNAVMKLDQEGTGSFASFAQQAKDATQGIGTALDNVQNRIAKAGASIINAIGAENISEAINAFSSSFAGIADIVVSAINAVKDAFAPLAGTFEQFYSMLGQVASAFGEGFFSTLGEQMPQALQMLSEAFGRMMNALMTLQPVLEPIANLLGTVLATALTIIVGLITTSINVLSMVVEVVANVYNAIVSFIQPAIDLWNSCWNTAISVVQSVWSGIMSAVSGAINAVSSTISSVLSFIQSAWNAAWNGVLSLASSIWSGITSAISGGVSGAVSAVTGFKDQVISFFSGAASWLIDSGKALIDGLVSGITGAIGGAVDAVASGISSIRDLFPFSPAKKGPFSGRGWVLYSGMSIMNALADGVEKQQGATVRSIGRTMNALAKATTFSGDYSLAYSTGYTTTAQSIWDEQASTTSTLLSRLTELSDNLNTYTDAVQNQETAVYVDGKKLASSIAKPINQQLGMMSKRGI